MCCLLPQACEQTRFNFVIGTANPAFTILLDDHAGTVEDSGFQLNFEAAQTLDSSKTSMTLTSSGNFHIQ